MYRLRFAEPPALKNGRVMPMTGPMRRHMAMLMNVWMAIMDAMPKPMYWAGPAMAALASRRMRKMTTPMSAMAATQPRMPSSSPMTVKIMSDSLTGTAPDWV